MSTIQPVDAATFFATGLAQINSNQQALLTLIQTLRATQVLTSICAPVTLTPTSDPTVWDLPTGIPALFQVLDHGMFLRGDEFTVNMTAGVPTSVTLGYTPATPYAITAAWSASGAGLVAPRALTQHPTLGTTFWLVPADVGPNPWVLDRGRVLRRDQYRIDADVIELLYTPATPLDLAITWGAGGAGMVPPVELAPVIGSPPGVYAYMLPPDAPEMVLAQDAGFMLEAADYTVDPDARTLTLTYAPAGGTHISASWGLPLGSLYMDVVDLQPLPDGSITHFIARHEPAENTSYLRLRYANGSVAHLQAGVDYQVDGRAYVFAVAPPVDSVPLLGMVVAVLNGVSADAVNGMEAVPYNAPGIGTDDQANKLVGTDLDGKLVPAILPFLFMASDDAAAGTGAADAVVYRARSDGKLDPKVFPFTIIPSDDAAAGTGLAAGFIPALRSDGKLDPRIIPAGAGGGGTGGGGSIGGGVSGGDALGTDNTSINLINGSILDQNTYSYTITNNADGSVAVITIKDGTTTVKTVTFTYNSNGTLASVQEVAGGHTFTQTFGYTSGLLTSVTNTST